MALPDPMDVIKKGLSTPATNSLGLTGLGNLASEQMQEGVSDRRKGLQPTPAVLASYGSPAAKDLFS